MLFTHIGLEIHIEAKTKTKMFCGCLNEPDEKEPNKNVCPICLGYPGTLPLLNKEAVNKVILLGLLLEGEIERFTFFERKHYFYPDLPKGYQISQYQKPIVKNAKITLSNGKKIRIKRIHIEEDTGKLYHHNNYSLVDYNRAGVPLIELVTEPDITNAQEAFEFAKKMREILVFNNISDASMEKGHLRLEANISLSKKNNTLGTKVEVKNLNSFKSLKESINYEIKRQTQLIKNNKKIAQETRGWNENIKKTIPQRVKEESDDYRYFREPDIPPLVISDEWIESIKKNLKKMPQDIKNNLKTKYNLNEQIVEVIFSNKNLAEIFEQIEAKAQTMFKNKAQEIIQSAINFGSSILLNLIHEREVKKSKFILEEFLKIIELYHLNKINNIMAKNLIKDQYFEGLEVTDLIKKYGLDNRASSTHIQEIVKEVITNNSQVVKSYLAGNEKVLQFLIGQGMKLARGKIDPKALKHKLIEAINSTKFLE